VIFSLAGMPFTRAHAIGLVLIAILTCVQRLRIAMGRASTECLHLDKVQRHGSLRCPRIRHWQGTLVEFQSSGAGRFDHGAEPRTVDLRFGVGLIAVFFAYDGWVLYQPGLPAKSKTRGAMCRWPWFRRAHGRRDLSRHEHDVCLRHATE